MPPKRRKKTKKEKPYIWFEGTDCEVRGCKNQMVCGWDIKTEDGSIHHKLCASCLSRDTDPNDNFNLYEHFRITEHKLDRFGFFIPCDRDLCLAIISTIAQKDQSQSINRLKEWKEKNKGKPKTKKVKHKKFRQIKPRANGKSKPKVTKVTTKKVSNDEMDDIMAGILG